MKTIYITKSLLETLRIRPKYSELIVEYIREDGRMITWDKNYSNNKQFTINNYPYFISMLQEDTILPEIAEEMLKESSIKYLIRKKLIGDVISIPDTTCYFVEVEDVTKKSLLLSTYMIEGPDSSEKFLQEFGKVHNDIFPDELFKTGKINLENA